LRNSKRFFSPIVETIGVRAIFSRGGGGDSLSRHAMLLPTNGGTFRDETKNGCEGGLWLGFCCGLSEHASGPPRPYFATNHSINHLV